MKIKKYVAIFMVLGLVMMVNMTTFGVELLKTVPYRINQDQNNNFTSGDVSIAKGKKPTMSSNTATVYTAGEAYGLLHKKELFGAFYSEVDYEIQTYSRPGQTRNFVLSKVPSSTDYRFTLMARDRSLNPTGLDMLINNVTVTY